MRSAMRATRSSSILFFVASRMLCRVSHRFNPSRVKFTGRLVNLFSELQHLPASSGARRSSHRRNNWNHGTMRQAPSKPASEQDQILSGKADNESRNQRPRRQGRVQLPCGPSLSSFTGLGRSLLRPLFCSPALHRLSDPLGVQLRSSHYRLFAMPVLPRPCNLPTTE